MTRAAGTALVVALAVVCLGSSSPASAAPALPVTLLSGLLTVSLVPAAAALSTTGSTVSGALGTSTIIDGRLGATGYDVSVTSTGFTLVGALSATSSTFIAGTEASVAASSPV